MPLVLAGSTSGSATLQATDAATVTLTLPASTGTLVVTGGAQTIEFADGSASAPSITNSGDTNTGMFFPAADTIAFTEGGTESMRIDASGNVGIGRTPDQRLQIASPTAVEYDMFVGSTRTLTLYADATQTIVAAPTAVPMIFRTTDTERFRIASSGETTFTGFTNFTASNFSGKLGTASTYGYWSNSNATSYLQFNGPSAGIPYVIYAAAGGGGVQLNFAATAWSSSSDARLKNITGTYQNALADIAQLEPVKFTWKSDVTNKPQVGVLAQSVLPVVPEAVDSQPLARSEDETEYLTVRYTELIPLMIASIQELKATVDAQAARIAALEGAA
jgi:hypothetical protein